MYNPEYHAFIAHSSEDSREARELYYNILENKYRAFLDSEDLLPGDEWDDKLPEYQKKSFSTIVLISKHTDESYYQREEIVQAISLVRKDNSFHRLIPVLLDDVSTPEIPYGLSRVQSIRMKEDDNIDYAAKRIVKTFKKLNTKLDKVNLDPAPHPDESGVVTHETKDITKQKEIPIADLISGVKQIILHHIKLGYPCSLCYIDLDKFTQINKNFGERVGDEVIYETIEIARDIMGKYYVKHIGADEIFVCMSGNNINEAKDLGKEVVEKIDDYPWWFTAHDLHVTASVGVTQLKHFNYEEVETAREWILRTLLGAKISKESGGNMISRGPKSLSKKKQENNDKDEKELDKEIKSHIS